MSSNKDKPTPTPTPTPTTGTGTGNNTGNNAKVSFQRPKEKEKKSKEEKKDKKKKDHHKKPNTISTNASPPNEKRNNPSESQKESGPLSFEKEIGLMLFSFGDAVKSHPSTIRLLDGIIKQHLIELVLTIHREKKTSPIEMEDVMLAAANGNVLVIGKLMEALSWKLPQTHSLAEYRARLRTLSSAKWRFKFRKFDHILDVLDEDSSKKPEDDSAESNPAVKFAMDLERVFVEKEKDQKTCCEQVLGENMTSDEFSHYIRCSQMTFISRSEKGVVTPTLTKFASWLGVSSRLREVKLTRTALEMLGIVGYHLLGVIALSSLIVQENVQLCPPSKFELARGVSSGLMDFSLRRRVSNLADVDVNAPLSAQQVSAVTTPNRSQIKPNSVMEAMRRLREIKVNPLAEGVHRSSAPICLFGL